MKHEPLSLIVDVCNNVDQSLCLNLKHVTSEGTLKKPAFNISIKISF